MFLRAEACHVSQPALSAAIRKLEHELGAPRHPGVRVEVRSLSSIEIGRRLADRELDAALRDADVAAAPRVEANSISALLSFARTGWSCVMAHPWLALQGVPAGMRTPRRARDRPARPCRASGPPGVAHSMPAVP